MTNTPICKIYEYTPKEYFQVKNLNSRFNIICVIIFNYERKRAKSDLDNLTFTLSIGKAVSLPVTFAVI